MKFLTNGFASITSIALIGVAFGLWTRQSPSEPTPGAPIQRNTVLTSHVGVSEPIDGNSEKEYEIPNSEDLALENHANVFRQVESGLDSNEPLGIDTASTKNSSKVIDMLPGIAHPLQTAQISAAADGPLWKLFVAEGEVVPADTVLALIDNRVAVASVIAAQSSADRQAMLKSANAKVSLAEQFLNRIQQAASKKAASGLEVDEATSRLAEAKAALQEGMESQREAEARLKIEQARLETFEVRAPFQGTVIKIYPHLGETVSRGAPLVKIADINHLRAELYVPLSIISTQHIGEMVELRADLPNRPLLKAKIVFIAPVIDAATQTTRTVVEIDNTSNQLPAGFAVRLSQTESSNEQN